MSLKCYQVFEAFASEGQKNRNLLKTGECCNNSHTLILNEPQANTWYEKQDFLEILKRTLQNF